MRIAYIIPSLARFGPNIVIHSIVSSKVMKQHDVVVYYFDEKEDVLQFDCPTRRISADEIVDFDYYDIVHSSMLRPDRYVYKNRHRIRKAQLVTTIHQDIYNNLKSTYNRFVSSLITPLWLRYMSCFSAAVPISQTIRNLYHKRLSNLSDIVYNGVNVDYNPVNQERNYAEEIKQLKKTGNIFLGTYAQITFRKGVDQIIDLVYYRQDVCAVIIGEGNAKLSLQHKVKELGVQDRVLFLPYLRAPYNYLENVDVYVMPSRSEGFGMAMVEAAFTRTPIICSDINVFREIYDDTQAAFFKLDDVYSMSAAIDKIMDNREKYINNSYEHVQECFSKEAMAQRYLVLYKHLLKK